MSEGTEEYGKQRAKAPLPAVCVDVGRLGGSKAGDQKGGWRRHCNMEPKNHCGDTCLRARFGYHEIIYLIRVHEPEKSLYSRPDSRTLKGYNECVLPGEC